MTHEEKNLLLELLEQPSNWCKEVEARDRHGEPVQYHDPKAVAWDVVGAMCRLFGWDRSVRLFVQTWRHITGRTHRYPAFSSEMQAMRSLQDFNDLPETDYELIISRIRGLRATA